MHERTVHLRGRVRTLPQKIISEALLRRLPEVDTVSNELVADPKVVSSFTFPGVSAAYFSFLNGVRAA